MTDLPLEQQRAASAWECAKRETSAGNADAYVKLAKGLPALIMNSGLMQVLAFLHEKGGKDRTRHCGTLGTDLREWLIRRHGAALRCPAGADFSKFMDALMKAEPVTFRVVTAEAFAWLRWIRQVGPAAANGGR